MAKITREEILQLARLSRLHLNEDEVQEFTEEIGKIIDYVKVLDNVDVSGLRPTYQVTGSENITRSDEVIDYKINQEDLLKNLPDREGNLIKVKRMIG
ncbi:Asp-tRNA(Asn)/Glu-tRNA(Gln) amidotransferase subunit GatC [Candidatus Saccharibacteria bacterium]|nr:Asp-tRNA(Asn)/Glu-tRNA(Gln) amidotransferase subunit GatC [Candidatus Saccharibacteria bacterium]